MVAIFTLGQALMWAMNVGCTAVEEVVLVTEFVGVTYIHGYCRVGEHCQVGEL